MTTPATARRRERHARLFAMLLREECERRRWFKKYDEDGITYFLMGPNPEGYYYHQFLRAQATYAPSSRGYCYHLALQAIGNG